MTPHLLANILILAGIVIAFLWFLFRKEKP